MQKSMPTIKLTVEEIPHGHGMSTKRGIADGLLEETKYENNLPNGHGASYRRGVKIGKELMQRVAGLVKE